MQEILPGLIVIDFFKPMQIRVCVFICFWKESLATDTKVVSWFCFSPG